MDVKPAFNPYVWRLYTQSSQGEKWLQWAERFDVSERAEEFDFLVKEIRDACEIEYSAVEIAELKNNGFDDTVFFKSGIDLSRVFFQYFNERKNNDYEQIQLLFDEWMDYGLEIHGIPLIESQDFWPAYLLESVSLALYRVNQELFFPYYFNCKFNCFEKICTEFMIPLPELPPKKDYRQRIHYYIMICQTLHEFRLFHGLSPAELCSFIYDFAPSCLDDKDVEELQKPTKVWWVGGNKVDFDFLDNPDQNSMRWQCNTDTRPGDIVVVYCLSPRSYIHSVWRSTCGGFIDPFFYYYAMTYISNPIHVPPVSHLELKENHIFSRNPLVRKNLQGLNGYGMSWEEYEELITIWKSKGFDTSNLPRIQRIKSIPNIVLKDERDVEIYLVEPLLKKLEYVPEDWIRQMPLKMGRGIRYYPDYCIMAHPERGEETARAILETKYTIKNKRELQDSYYQAKSYAIRLRSKCFAVTAREGIWLFQLQKDTFEFDRHIYYTWDDLDNPDKFHIMLVQFGKKTLLKYKI